MIILKNKQYLSDALSQIPTNCILSKRIPGCGATTLELMTDRNSIIIVPNVPVIQSKVTKFQNMKGVYEDVSVSEIITYLKENNRYKIMTTPESFGKIKVACEKCSVNIYSKFFLLMDECHQLVKDVDYRSYIVLPMADFFRFKNKAMVSATPLGFSDPRLRKFETLEVRADYDYQQDITVINTCNITKAIGDYLENHQSGAICFFVNSATQIYSIMKHFKLLGDSTVYCAHKSVSTFKEGYDFTNAYVEWSAETMKRYNFFTGRFFSAFDLELDYKPDLLMITDPYLSPYTMLDVDTDCIQICGRFRNGLNSATHIYRVDSEICVKNKEQVEQDIHDLEIGYRTLQRYYNNADSREDRMAFGQVIDIHPYRKYLYPDLTKNWFRIDCKVNEVLVEGRYKSEKTMTDWYNDCHYFTPTFEECNSNENDEKMEIIMSARTERDKRKKIVEILSLFEQPLSENAFDFINKIRKIDPFIVEAFEQLGRKEIEEQNYNQQKINEKIIMKQRKGNRAIRLIKNSFKVGNSYTNDYIKDELTRIFDMLQIHPERTVKGSMIKDYFQVEAWSNGKNRGYKLIMAIV
jgi:hypothetical protein